MCVDVSSATGGDAAAAPAPAAADVKPGAETITIRVKDHVSLHHVVGCDVMCVCVCVSCVCVAQSMRAKSMALNCERPSRLLCAVF